MADEDGSPRDDAVAFAALFAHELRKPLSTVILALDALATRIAEEPELAGLTARLDRNIGRVVDLLDELVMLVMALRGTAPVPVSPVRADELVREALSETQPLMDDLDHHVEVELPPELPVLHVHEAPLRRALVHLLRNAAVYTNRGGHVHVKVEREDGPTDPGQLAIVIRDDGRGIAPELLEQVFEPMVRGGAPRVAPGGLGIGLALVRAVVELHGGRVRASSQGPGTGTTVRVTLPLRSAATASSEWRCLLVRGGASGDRMLELLLQSWGYTVATARDASQARALASDHDPAVVLVDLDSVGRDARSLAQELASVGVGDARWIVVGEGEAPDGARRVPKPVDPDQLKAALVG